MLRMKPQVFFFKSILIESERKQHISWNLKYILSFDQLRSLQNFKIARRLH